MAKAAEVFLELENKFLLAALSLIGCTAGFYICLLGVLLLNWNACARRASQNLS